jgi:hypothetical protein
MTKDVKRLTLKAGKQRRTVVIENGPIPELGSTVTFQGVEWTVTKIAADQIIAAFQRDGKRLITDISASRRRAITAVARLQVWPPCRFGRLYRMPLSSVGLRLHADCET